MYQTKFDFMQTMYGKSNLREISKIFKEHFFTNVYSPKETEKKIKTAM